MEEYLYLPEAQNEKYWDLDTDNWLESLGAIKSVNIFVGANNSGKSRLMRMLLRKNLRYFLPQKQTIINYKKLVDKLEEKAKLNTLESAISSHFRDRTSYKSIIESLVNDRFNTQKSVITQDIKLLNSYLREDKRSAISVYEDLERINQTKTPQVIYIPILRSALTFYRNDFGQNPQVYSENIYEKTVWELYDFASRVQEKKNFEVFTGKNLYEQIKRDLLSPRNTRDNFRAFEKFIGDIFFNEKIEIGVIDSQEDKNKHIRVYFEKDEKDIQNLGDGIQTIIILTYKLFMAEKGAWIFIEEPELNLHPAYQRIFLELITELSKEKNLRIFFTTHSNHLLDITITQNSDISIFVFERGIRDNQNVSLVRNVSAMDLQTLDTLGVHNSSVFMANCSIWVEGITDRIYIRNYLKAYMKHCQENSNENLEFEQEYKEDLHFAFFEYAGTNLKHYTFDDSEDDNIKVPNRVFVVADQDLGKEGKHNAFKEQLGEKYEVLKVREIENLLKGEFIKSILPKWRFEDVTYNTEVLKDIEFKEIKYKNKFLKTYLVELFEDKKIDIPETWKKNPKKTFSSDHKKKLADFTNNITWDKMSKEAQELTKKVYNFIRANNQTKA